jgi:N-acetylglucosamine-6-phosphate deacetylase
VITTTWPQLLSRLDRLGRILDAFVSASNPIAGIHLEGPFFNPLPGFIGAHRADCVRPATPELAKELVDAARGHIKLITLAPECDADAQTTRWLVSQGIRVAAGHCDPSLGQLRRSMDSGLTLFTHLGNACPPLLARHDNIIQRVLSLAEGLYITLIADGAHLPWFTLGNYLRLIPPDRAIIVSDATALGGQPPGNYEFNGRPVTIDSTGIARLAEEPELLAGSTTLLDEALPRLQQWLNLTPSQLRKLTWNNPMQALGLPLAP